MSALVSNNKVLHALTKNSWQITIIFWVPSQQRMIWSYHDTSRHMMTSSNGNISPVTGRLCGEFTGHRRIPLTKASDAELLMFSFICTWTNSRVNSRNAGDLRRHRAYYCPACRTTLVATRFRVAVICPIIQVPHCIRVFFYFVWFVFINHIFQFYYELCTYCNILDIYLS